MKLIISLIFAASLAHATTYDLSLLVVDETITPTLNNTAWVASDQSSASWIGTVTTTSYRTPLFDASTPNDPCYAPGNNGFTFSQAGNSTVTVNFAGCTDIVVETPLGVPFDIQTLTHGTPAQPEQLAIIYDANVPVPDSAVPETETLAMLGIGLTLIGLLAAKRAGILTAPRECE